MNAVEIDIKSDRLLLRRFQDNDLENVFKGLSNPEVIKHYGVSYDTLEGTKAQMKWFNDLEASGEGLWWAVCSKDNTQFYGSGGVCDLSVEHRRAEIGFWLLPEFWGNGFMQEAMPLIVDYCFQKLNLHRIEGFVESHNKNCKRAMEKLDFEFEGTMRDYEIKNGELISIDIYAKINKGNF